MDSTVRAGRLVAWGNAVLSGQVSPDTAADKVVGTDRVHRVHPATPGPPATLPVFLAGLRTHGVRGLLLVLPVPGDPIGLPGPPAFNDGALDAGTAVLLLAQEPLGLIPTVTRADPDGPPGFEVTWVAHDVGERAGRDLPSLREAELHLTQTLHEVTEHLAALDLAGWRPQLAAALAEIREGAPVAALAPGYPGRAHRLLAQAQRVTAIADLVATDPDAGTGIGTLAGRDAELRRLSAAARHATLAAFNSVAEPGITASNNPVASDPG